MLGGWKKSLYISMCFPILLAAGGCGKNDTLNSNLSSSSATGIMGGTGVTSEVSHPAEMSVGDIMPVEFGEETTQKINFDNVDTSAQFVLIVGSAMGSGSGTTMQISSDLSTEASLSAKSAQGDGEEGVELDLTSTEILDTWLRAAEFDMAFSLPAPDSVSSTTKSLSSSTMAKASSLGSVRDFKVLASLSSVTSYVTVQGKLRCSGSYVDLWVDTRISDDDLSSSDIQSLCGQYDDVAKTEYEVFGDVSDVDGDRKVAAFITYQTNKLGYYANGIITGYFWAGDLSISAAEEEWVSKSLTKSSYPSNNMEIVYLIAPDPDGVYGTPISLEMAEKLELAVFPHELQHAISYNEHVFKHGGLPEENWANEGWSHWAEDFTGYNFENAARYNFHLANPSSTSLVATGSPDLAERGAAYLFLRFLYEQAADPMAFVKNAIQTSKRGVENLEAAFAGKDSNFDQFSEFFGRWTVAVAMSNEGISADPRYVYRVRERHEVTGNWTGVCLSCDAEDGRGTVLEGVHLSKFYGYHTVSISPSAAKFYEITTVPGSIEILGTEGGGNYAILIRTR